MATSRQRASGTWEFIVKRSKMLPRPIVLSFPTEEEGKRYCDNLERLLDSGIIPQEFADAQAPAVFTIGEAIKTYREAVAVPDSDQGLLNSITKKKGAVRLSEVNIDWIDAWITSMKRVENLAPSTIRHNVGALRRCFAWCVRRKVAGMLFNPILELPSSYAKYSEHDEKAVLVQGGSVRVDEERDRRLLPEEERRVRQILDGEKSAGKQRELELNYRGALELMFDLALESGMRLREMFTLTTDQVDVSKLTFFLDKTKNGSKRQVPMTTVAVSCLKVYYWQVENGERGMDGFNFDGGRLFPWWSGELADIELRRTTARLSGQFGRIFDAAGCSDVHFHDLRHEATSRMFERTQLSDAKIAKIVGHKSTKMLMRYANLRGSDLAVQLW